MARSLRRRAAVRQPFERLLVVCEGEKTEPLYLEEIRQELRLSSATVQVHAGAAIHRNEVDTRLKKYLPGYDKGQGGHWARTKDRLPVATGRAEKRAVATNAFDGIEAFTDMHRLVARLVHLRD